MNAFVESPLTRLALGLFLLLPATNAWAQEGVDSETESSTSSSEESESPDAGEDVGGAEDQNSTEAKTGVEGDAGTVEGEAPAEEATEEEATEEEAAEAEAADEEAREEDLPPERIDVKPDIPGRQTYRDLVDAGTILGAVGGGFLLASFLTSSVHMRSVGALDTAQTIAWIPFGGPVAAAIYDEEENHIAASARYREDAVGHMVFEITSFVIMAIGLENVREGKWWKNKLLLEIEQERLLSLEIEPTFGGLRLLGRF